MYNQQFAKPNYLLHVPKVGLMEFLQFFLFNYNMGVVSLVGFKKRLEEHRELVII